MNITPFRDIETQRQQRNLTASQKKTAATTKEGVVVNSFVKEPNVNMNDLRDSMIISEDVKIPELIKEDKHLREKSILPIAGIATGVMAGITGLTMFIKNNTKVITGVTKASALGDFPRNIQVNQETHQAIFRMVQCPTRKTIIAGVGVLALTAMGFMGKIFLDGFKDVWIKKKEADIQKNLQEKLINVETQSFSGKIQIIRNMLSEKTREFNEKLCPSGNCKTFAGVSFGSDNKKPISEKQKNNLKYFAIGGATLAGIIGLGFLSLKNLGASKKAIENFIQKTKGEIEEIVTKTSDATKKEDILGLKERFQAIGETPSNIVKTLKKTNWPEKEQDDILFDITKSVVNINKELGGDGRGKPSFLSFVDDYRAFFYNWLLDPSNKQFRNLFFGITGTTAASYGGKVMGEAVKDVQVKKMNADTELQLQQRLVSTELRNFKAKKDAAINPLCEEFYKQLNNGKPKTELKTMADNILFEVKNGPPFVYS